MTKQHPETFPSPSQVITPEPTALCQTLSAYIGAEYRIRFSKNPPQRTQCSNFNELVLVPCVDYPENFIQIHPQIF